MELKMDLLKDANGQLSSMRVMSMLLTVLPAFVWALTCVRQNTIMPVPQELLEMMGLGLAGKILQKPFEKAPIVRIEEPKP